MHRFVVVVVILVAKLCNTASTVSRQMPRSDYRSLGLTTPII